MFYWKGRTMETNHRKWMPGDTTAGSPVSGRNPRQRSKAFFEKYMCTFSVPTLVISDQGEAVCNQIFKELDTQTQNNFSISSPMQRSSRSCQQNNRKIPGLLRRQTHLKLGKLYFPFDVKLQHIYSLCHKILSLWTYLRHGTKHPTLSNPNILL